MPKTGGSAREPKGKERLRLPKAHVLPGRDELEWSEEAVGRAVFRARLT